MSRPLLNADIGKLERLYLAGERDTTQLRQLEHELGFRTTARAEALVQKVQAALRRCTSGELFPVETKPPSVPTKAEPINVTAIPVAPPRAPPSPPPPASPVPPAEPPRKRAATGLPSKEPKEIAAAYEALNLAPGAAWEEIESSRRAIVAQARPAVVASLPLEQADALRLDAFNANRAAALLRSAAILWATRKIRA